MQEFINNAFAGENSDKQQTQAFFNQVMLGDVEPILLAGVLGALKVKGETPEEIAGAAGAMRANALEFNRPDYLIADSCGTGGDGADTINISTTTAIVAAACGLKMTKHGNRSVSSKSGSSDLLEGLGINLTPSPEQSRKCLDEAGICFFFAPQYHSGVKHAMPVRQTMKTRTIFNILGPLANPAAPDIQLLGVYSADLLKPIAETLKQLGLKRAMVVHGSGLDEIALHGETQVCELKDGQISQYRLSPADFGVNECALSDIKGGTPAENKQICLNMLSGKGEQAHLNAVAINVSALLYMAGLATDLKQGTQIALDAMQSGKALATLNKFVELSNG
ncbi:anthranilate phosphoribosyltransferase [Catenovulum agarivorans DS-2]|uniref:Anthranilate phosphoribosyltransferase n=1 Tax=Catenovulum agarivorans DS-2 TaxID=1328313 RepID=W7QAP7_9ALTE|nr:anthranilate phosphoribosyltransferase [Catenovulum agarivorans]EWH09899.1 anthranilate phosphoribosyltransferase [Catenovulum agarivorans DS-2]